MKTYIDWPEVSEEELDCFIEGLHDYFTEISIVDTETGYYGITEGERKLAKALMESLLISLEVKKKMRFAGMDYERKDVTV